MLQLSGAGKRFGHKLLFDELDWLITPKERTGLVGGNGTGKSTLLKVIGGIESLDYGSLSAMKGIRLGYLPQDGLQVGGRTVFAECLSVFSGVKELEQEIEALPCGQLVLLAQLLQVTHRRHHHRRGNR